MNDSKFHSPHDAHKLIETISNQRRFDRVKRSPLVNHVRPYLVWESGFAPVFHYKSPDHVSNTSLSTVHICLADLDVGQ